MGVEFWLAFFGLTAVALYFLDGLIQDRSRTIALRHRLEDIRAAHRSFDWIDELNDDAHWG